MEKSKLGKEGREHLGEGGSCSFGCHTREDFIVKLTSGYRLEGGKGGSCADIWRKSLLGGRMNRCKGPGVLVYSQKSIQPG